MTQRYVQPKETELLTCNDVRISVFALVFWVLRVLSCVFIQARIRSNFFVFLAETNILKQQIQCQYRGPNYMSLSLLKWFFYVLFKVMHVFSSSTLVYKKKWKCALKANFPSCFWQRFVSDPRDFVLMFPFWRKPTANDSQGQKFAFYGALGSLLLELKREEMKRSFVFHFVISQMWMKKKKKEALTFKLFPLSSNKRILTTWSLYR